MPNFMLSPCGTSLLTNEQAPNERGLIFHYANSQSEAEIPAEDLEQLQRIIQNREHELLHGSIASAQRLSAELNSIIAFYGQQLPQKQDHHLLLCSDTFLGEATAQIVKKWLEKHVGSAVVHRQQDLQTRELEPFQQALSQLIRELSEQLPQWRKENYRIIFNLTGGFKSVQGFLQSIAHFYADETIYIFESATELLRIPRLPVQLNLIDTVKAHLHTFRRLAKGLTCSPESLQAMPDVFLLHFKEQTGLSPWGELVWEQSKDAIYAESLHPSLSERIIYSDKFKKTVASLPPDRKQRVNTRMDQLARCLETTPSDNPRALDFKTLKGNPRPPSTHECDAWSDQDAQRIFGHFQDTEQSPFIIDDLTKKCE